MRCLYIVHRGVFSGTALAILYEMVLSVIALYLLMFQAAIANDLSALACPDSFFTVGNVNTYQFRRSNGDCGLRISTGKKIGAYRDYAINSSGLFQIFTLYGGERISDGARAYFLFPRITQVCATTIEEKVVTQLPNGERLIVDATTNRIADITGASLRQADQIHESDQGGLDLRPMSGIILDLGFRVKASPLENVGGISKFMDAKGKHCTIANQLLFEYSYVKRDGVYVLTKSGRKQLNGADFKFKTDRELAGFLSKYCPMLDRSSLEKSVDSAPTICPQVDQ